jgi:hypothetical protein
VQPLSDELLAGAMLAEDEDVGIRRSDALDQLQHRPHLRRLGDEPWRAVGAPIGGRVSAVAPEEPILRVEPAGTPKRAPQLDQVAQRDEESRVVPRLLDVVLGAAPHRFHRAAHASPRGHDRDREVRFHVFQAVKQVEPLVAGGRVPRVVHVHQQRVVVTALERDEHSRRRCDRLDLEAFSLEEETQRLEDVRLIVGDQDGRGRRRGRRRGKDGHVERKLWRRGIGRRGVFPEQP